MRDLLANEGIDDRLRTAFIVYLLSHDRPMHEVLTARRRDISQEYERGFAGMTEQPVALEELLAAREDTINAIVGDMPDDHRQFLVSFERGNPDWPLLGLEHAEELPAVRWRQINLDKLDDQAQAALVENLKRVLGV